MINQREREMNAIIITKLTDFFWYYFMMALLGLNADFEKKIY